MKSKILVGMLIAFVLTSCEQKNVAIQNELRLIEKTAKDNTQPDYVRDSAATFKKILREEKNVSKDDWSRARGGMMMLRSETTITTNLSFLKGLEKKLSDKLPPAETYETMSSKAGKAKIIEYNLAQTVLMMSNSIQNITLYNDPVADDVVAGVLERLRKKYGAFDTGKKILELLNTVHNHGLTERSWGIKPWESPKPGSSH